MGFFEDLFNRSTEKEEQFNHGRFSDAYKPSAHQKIWEESLLAFEYEKYLEATKNLLDFLKNLEGNNIKYSLEKEEIRFELFQGSKLVTGIMNLEHFRAEVKVAKAESLNIGLSRKLLERNYLLQYSRFGLDDEGHILLIFDSYTVDASPNKLYQGLKEMATQADKLDDLILNEFRGLEAINIEHTLPRSAELKEKQYLFLKTELKNCFQEIENGKLNVDQFPGGLSFLLLATNYKLDYLLTPEGYLMDNLEQNHKSFFGNNSQEVGYRNGIMIKSFRKILERSETEVKEELYDVISTFGLPAPTPHETLANLIQKELLNMQWYKENNHHAIALSIPSYIVGFSLFSYALPKPDMDLLDLFYKITEPEYFNTLSYHKNQKLQSKNIKKAIEKVEDEYNSIYPSLKIDSSKLDFSSMVNFSESYLIMIKNIDLDGEDRR